MNYDSNQVGDKRIREAYEKIFKEVGNKIGFTNFNYKDYLKTRESDARKSKFNAKIEELIKNNDESIKNINNSVQKKDRVEDLDSFLALGKKIYPEKEKKEGEEVYTIPDSSDNKSNSSDDNNKDEQMDEEELDFEEEVDERKKKNKNKKRKSESKLKKILGKFRGIFIGLSLFNVGAGILAIGMGMYLGWPAALLMGYIKFFAALPIATISYYTIKEICKVIYKAYKSGNLTKIKMNIKKIGKKIGNLLKFSKNKNHSYDNEEYLIPDGVIENDVRYPLDALSDDLDLSQDQPTIGKEVKNNSDFEEKKEKDKQIPDAIESNMNNKLVGNDNVQHDKKEDVIQLGGEIDPNWNKETTKNNDESNNKKEDVIQLGGEVDPNSYFSNTKEESIKRLEQSLDKLNISPKTEAEIREYEKVIDQADEYMKDVRATEFHTTEEELKKRKDYKDALLAKEDALSRLKKAKNKMEIYQDGMKALEDLKNSEFEKKPIYGERKVKTNSGEEKTIYIVNSNSNVREKIEYDDNSFKSGKSR